MILNKLIPGILLLAVGTAANAEVGGLLNGRSADLNKLPDSSVELGFNTGELGGLDYQYIGVRYNHRVNPQLMAFADVGTMEVSFPISIVGFSDEVSADEFGFGIGAFYMLDGILDTADTAVKGSFHTFGGDIDWNVISIEAIVSGRNGLGSNSDLQWYANFGINRIDSETELLLGAGLVLPTQSGEIYGGLDLIDDMQFGIGYRHFL